ncbi:SDR family NAD(P)-dependent oxidoreductase [Chelativorans sp. Marseille-P2723]|uniref:SDR family NAD(P)-dependent oxidoreductase n=1 Tax=Chelativorans sp. Marseille-P2723 TaxID=2709133 RepID=UPI001570C4B6|nr:SDR family NAD(P)-dependent oxidoreductase [Chelativorans sp. Marseille-P2723]
MGTLDNKIALITGAGDGMGRAHAVLMARRGADIAIADINEEMARETAEMVRATGRRAHYAVVDMADTEAVIEMAREAGRMLGRIDILVNNAGFGQRALIEEIREEDFDRMMAVHVRGSFFCTQAVVPAMKEARYGKIINISSIWGMAGAPVASHYCGAKAALLGFTKAWAKELAPWNIHVNAVAPGGVRSGGPTKLDNSDVLKAKEEKVPLKRYCEPVEISYAVAYLASPEADFVTGQVISPNGGETIVGY